MTVPSIDPAADLWLRRLVAELLEPQRLEALVGRAFEQICRDVPELTTPVLRRSLERTLFALSRTMLPGLVSGARAADLPDEAFDLVEALVRDGLDLPVLLRVCRSGQHATVLSLTEQVTMSALGESASQQLVMHIVGHTTDWAGTAAEALSTAFQRARAVSPAEVAARRREAVRAILVGGPVDIDAAEARLGYRLEGSHLAMVVWNDEEFAAGLRALRRRAEEIAAAVDAADVLIVPHGEQTVWAWAARPRHERAGTEAAGPGVALGIPATGVHGFRRSHLQALAAQRIARLLPAAAGVTAFDTVQIEHLISQDQPGMADFVCRELGPLAGADAAAVRLRETLRGYLDAMCSVEATARALDIHRNTVRYRLDRIEELLGHSVPSRRLELEIALRGVELLAVGRVG
ncbi:PucR family transcriptional regulator [Nocardia higoensis]|uniref:PucR family transcriptional regulator n=1 Tax=Nocardia higoensis TaxID=228599 RepID=UPI00030ABB3B|nr:helix-turn-helix domain-containing protein [Nocardia higoensis]